MTRDEKRAKLVAELDRLQNEINEKRRRVTEIKRQIKAMDDEARRERLEKLDAVIRENNRTIEDVINEVQADGARLPGVIEEPEYQNSEY